MERDFMIREDITDMTLIELLFKCRQEYENNSSDTFNRLTANIEMFNKQGTKSKGVRLRVTNAALEKMINGFCNQYGVFRRWDKGFDINSAKAVYNGTYNDVVQSYLLAFWDLIVDPQYIPKDEHELYKKLRETAYDHMKSGIEKISERCVSAEEYTSGYDDSGGNITTNLIDKEAYKQFCEEMKEKDEHEYKAKDSPYYIGIFRDLKDILYGIDVKKLLYSNADFKRNLIDIVKTAEAFGRDYPNDGKLKTQEKIAELFESVFGKKTSKKEISTFFSETFDTLSNCAVGYKFAKRSDYIHNTEFKSDNDTEPKSKKKKRIYRRCIDKVHKVLSTDMEKRLKKLCESNTDKPVKGSSKIFAALTKGIDETACKLESKGYTVDKNAIRKISLYLYNKPEYWNLWEYGKSNIKLTYYNRKEGNTYTYLRSKTVEMTESPEIYTIGNCVIIADENKKLHYLQKENRLFKVSRHEGVYYGYLINKNLKNNSCEDENDTKPGNILPLYMSSGGEVLQNKPRGGVCVCTPQIS